jgi:MG2 domain
MRRKLLIAAGVVGLLGMLLLSQSVCLSAWWKWGIVTKRCPSGTPRQTCVVDVSTLRRGAEGGAINVNVWAHFTTNRADDVMTVGLEKYDLDAVLVDASGKERPVGAAWEKSGQSRWAKAQLASDIPDGDYKLRARVASKLGQCQAEANLGLYAPARIHVITDRPLYEPGNKVQFRAVALRARDLAPIESRPGTWIVTDPSGEVLLEEKAPAGKWGVVAGSFPLDVGAANGEWKVAWRSGDAVDEVTFTVEPFTLPRFRLEATADKPYYQKGDRPVVSGAAIYSSGAPVAGAEITISWGVGGAWPAPTEWTSGNALPKTAIAGPNGRFTLTLPPIPTDVRGTATLMGSLSAIDSAGDRVEGATSLLLVEDTINVSAVTELGEGLVEGSNNRVYLRVTSADGSVLANHKVLVKRAWEPSDPGQTAETDADGVASVQLDPGPPVNIVEDPMPVRPPPAPPPVSRSAPQELLQGEEVSLSALTAMDRWLAPLARCGKWVGGDDSNVTASIRVAPGGNIVAVATEDTPLGSCVNGVLAGQRLIPGPDRLFTLNFSFTEPQLPSLTMSFEPAQEAPEALEGLLEVTTRDARDCLPDQIEGELPRMVVWQVRRKQRNVALTWVRDADTEREAGMGAGLARAEACLASRLRAITLPEDPTEDALGVASFTVYPVGRETTEKAEPTIRTGYQLAVTATKDDKAIGSTKLFLAPGTVPPLRLRATPVLAKVGERVRFELIRGPGYKGELAKKLIVKHFKGEKKLDVDAETRGTSLIVEEGMEGWLEVSTDSGNARALVYLQPKADMTVALASDKTTYAPGEMAQLTVKTTVDGKPGEAAVGLFGLDETMGQIATLRGPDDLGRLRPPATMSAPAFGILDGQALVLGRIRGPNAAAATVLRVTAFPQVPDLDATASGRGESQFDPVAELTDRFYIVLAELHDQTRAWQQSAKKGEQMKPETMAKLWNQALAACEKRGDDVKDAYGRRLVLKRLPPDLLALTSPQVMVTDGTRLPEDVEDWASWVGRQP